MAKKLTGWKRKLVDLVSEETGCKVQHNGSPCNTCFHSVFCKELGQEIGHRFWGVVLVARGDYTEEDILTNEEEYEKLIKKERKNRKN